MEEEENEVNWMNWIAALRGREVGDSWVVQQRMSLGGGLVSRQELLFWSFLPIFFGFWRCWVSVEDESGW